jgi:hypothetical protein
MAIFFLRVPVIARRPQADAAIFFTHAVKELV